MRVTSGISTELQALWKARLESLISEFQHYYTITRMSPIKGGLRTFIRGLILSSSVIDEIRQDLPSSYLISWGQVMDAKGFLSKEMDAIIYSGRPYKRWENIGYAIVPKENVKATVEFEVYPAWAIYPKKGKENYYQTQYEDRKNFTPRQYFFFEQYSAREESYKKAKEQIKSYGYDDVFVLYLSYKDKIEPHYSDWFSFLQMIRSLGT